MYITVALLVGGVIGFSLGLVLPSRNTFPSRLDTTPRGGIPTSTPYTIVKIVIAVQKIPCGVSISETVVATVPWISYMAPVSAFYTTENVIGKYAMVDIPREMPILSGMLVDSTDELPDYCKAE